MSDITYWFSKCANENSSQYVNKANLTMAMYMANKGIIPPKEF